MKDIFDTIRDTIKREVSYAAKSSTGYNIKFIRNQYGQEDDKEAYLNKKTRNENDVTWQ